MCPYTRRCNFTFEKFRCRYNAGESESRRPLCVVAATAVGKFRGCCRKDAFSSCVQIESENRPFVGIKITKLITSEEGL